MKYNIPERVLKDISAFAKKYSINKVNFIWIESKR